MKRLKPLEYLSRSDKWYLGGGNRLLWAPPFPLWLNTPGFWDKAQYYNFDIEPVFTWTLLDEDGKEILLNPLQSEWNPSHLLKKFKASGLEIVEEKCCLPNDILGSFVTIRNTTSKRRTLHMVAWTAQSNYEKDNTSWLTEVCFKKNRIHFEKHVQPSGHPQFKFSIAFGLNRDVTSFCIIVSENSVMQPKWKLSPFWEKFSNGLLPHNALSKIEDEDGVIFMALHTKLHIGPKDDSSLAIFFGAGSSKIEVASNLQYIRQQKTPVKISQMTWNDYFSTVPYFECSDKYLTRYYWYRWYGLKLLTINGQEGNYQSPSVCEGIGYFRAPISYSAMCHMLETRWQSNPSLCQGILKLFIANQREDGGFHGYIDVNHYRSEMFYHANWGRSLIELNRIHPDLNYCDQVYDGIVKYVEYFDRERDAEGSGLYDIQNHYETGQEYMHRYLAVDPDADKEHWGNVFRLKGVDVSVYLYELKKVLAFIAESIGRPQAEREQWSRGAEGIKRAILEKMWDPHEEMFFDVDPHTRKRTMVKAASCFYPYMTDIVNDTHINGFKKHLFNPQEFWTPFPIPSSSVDDEYFSSTPDWKGKRMNCPWNGRVWPMTNSHIAEAIAQTANRFDDIDLKVKGAEFINKYIRMMFFEADSERPNCFEHYNPFTGQPSLYRGIDDYQHSWVADLIIKYVGGIRPEDERVIIDPFPFNLSYVILENVVIKGHLLNVHRRKDRITVWVDGKKYKDTQIGKPIIIRL